MQELNVGSLSPELAAEHLIFFFFIRIMVVMFLAR